MCLETGYSTFHELKYQPKRHKIWAKTGVHSRITSYCELHGVGVRCFQADTSRATFADKLVKFSAPDRLILPSAKWHEEKRFTSSRLVRLAYESDYARGCPSCSAGQQWSTAENTNQANSQGQCFNICF